MQKKKNQKLIRTFVALDVVEEARELLVDTVEKLKRMGFKANWTKPQNFHLTLFFLGELPQSKIVELANRMSEILAGFPTFSYVINSIGFFPYKNLPRVLWFGADGGNTLISLYEETKKSIMLCNIPIDSTDEKFIPHLTIGRMKYSPPMWEKLIKDIKFEKIMVPVSEIHIFSSTLTRRGPIYKKMYTIEFEGGLMVYGERKNK